MLPPGWKFLNLSLENFILSIRATAKQLKYKSVRVVEDVGTIPVGPTSRTLGKRIFTSLCFKSALVLLDEHPMIFIPNLFACEITDCNSGVFPE